MNFECDKDLMLDESAQIHVYANKGDELIFDFNINLEEIEDLEKALRRARDIIISERAVNYYAESFCDAQESRILREKKKKSGKVKK
jgi:hypothetical protein